MYKKLVFISLSLLLLMAPAAYGEIAVIVNPANSLSALTLEQVQKIFLGKTRTFANDVPIVAVDQKESSKARLKFYKEVVRKTPSQLNAYWSVQIFSGKSVPPNAVGTDKDVVEFVAGNTGGIGYVTSDQVNDSVKVVFKIQ